jgi:maltose alpha-D-glucosyltransferase/alpha-amylase
MAKTMPEWFRNAVFYEIYPQSFRDADGDGIGDLAGIIEKLDYVKSLGVDGIWLNPCFDSPFQDAGYDVRDYLEVAPRYGTNDDLARLIGEVHKRGMRLLLDLVPGHTSLEHPWFKAAVSREKTPFDDYYVFTDGKVRDLDGYPFITGYGERDGFYMINYFYSQPALNYGFSDPKPEHSWQLATGDPRLKPLREEIRQVMKHYLDAGCDGFRVDLAFSLVKGKGAGRDEALKALWRDYSSWMKKYYPDAILVAEGGRPDLADDCGFDSDFLMPWGGTKYAEANKAMFRAEEYESHTDRLKPESRRSFFSKESSGNSRDFMDELEELLEYDGGAARFSIITGNHDEVRLRRQRTVDEIKVAFACIFTLPGRPFLYYGDEIGMKYLPQVCNIEGSYWRGGSRSPMQWERGEKAGFSAAAPEMFYIMLDPDRERPCVADQENDPDSLLNFTRKLIALRHTHPALGAEGKLRCLVSERADAPLVYERELGGERFLVAINPSAKEREFEIALSGTSERLVGVGDVGIERRDVKLHIAMSGVSAGVFRLHDRERETV